MITRTGLNHRERQLAGDIVSLTNRGFRDLTQGNGSTLKAAALTAGELAAQHRVPSATRREATDIAKRIDAVLRATKRV